MKKVLKIIGILVLILIILLVILSIKGYIESQKPVYEDDYYKDFQSNEELETKYSKLGNYEVSYEEHESENSSIKKIRIWYPKELENNNNEYPMIIVVNASGVPAFRYEPFFKRLASWGFIVVGNEDGQTGTGETTSITLDYMLNISNDSKLYNKIDKNNIGIIGYSQGGAGAIRAVTEYENGKNYKTIFTGSAAYPFLANNMGWNYDTSKIKIPYFMTAGTGKSDDSGKDSSKEFGGVAPLSSLIENYDKITKDVFKIRARSVGTEHEDMLVQTDSYMTAWMLYQLQDDKEASKIFVGDDAEILHNKKWQDIEKNK